MAKTKPFSIYLLKLGYNALNSLNEGHTLQPVAGAQHLPPGTSLFILDAAPKEPWWRDYFGIDQPLFQTFKGAILFVPLDDRCFAVTFGHVAHHLKDAAYEYDFGLIVTLNSLIPNALKGAEMVAPGEARRKRTQVPISTELTYLDFDENSEIIKNVSGKVKKRYEPIFKSATGSTSLKITIKLPPAKLQKLCRILLRLYNRTDYEASFPNIQNISPVRDPDIVRILDEALIVALREKSADVTLSIPAMDYESNTCCVFQGGDNESEIYPDISVEHFFEYLGEDFNFAGLSLEEIKSCRMILTDADGNAGPSYGIYRSLIFETTRPNDGASYHLCDGAWYKVQPNFIERLRTYLDGKCTDTDLLPYNHDVIEDGIRIYSEASYNNAAPVWQQRFICLDKTDISPSKNTGVEPCDIYSAIADQSAHGGYRGVLYFVKISTRSSQLSHLFNQGANAIDLIGLDEEARDKMRILVEQRLNGNDLNQFTTPIENREFKVVFSIITHKEKDAKSENLPLFSKISLMRNMQHLDLMKVVSELTFVPDESPKKGGHKKYLQAVVQVYQTANGKREVRPIAGQELDTNSDIARIPKAIRNAPVGSQFRVSIKIAEDGKLSSYFDWPYQAVATS
jgi:uncharacterized protein (TIGR04141 family)